MYKYEVRIKEYEQGMPRIVKIETSIAKFDDAVEYIEHEFNLENNNVEWYIIDQEGGPTVFGKQGMDEQHLGVHRNPNN